MAQVSAGLAGVIAGQSAISLVEHDDQNTLYYRGYEIQELCRYASFEEVAYLLVYGSLPSPAECKKYQERLTQLRTLPDSLTTLLEAIPGEAHPMDVLRTACSFLGTLEPETNKHDQYTITDRLLACFPAILVYWYHYHQHHKKIDTASPILNTAEYFLQLLHQKKPEPLQVHAMTLSLILYAEHEFNASTFAARVTAATLSDFYSCMCSAIATLRGPLHGGANEEALKLILKFKSPAEVESGLRDMLSEKKLIMGFGHRVYKTADPRSDIIKKESRKLATAAGDKVVYPVSEAIEATMRREKKNVS